MAFILAGVVAFVTLVLWFFTAFAEGMATAPKSDGTPLTILISGLIIASLIGASHWLPHISL